MKQSSIFLINFFLLINSIRNENDFNKAWQSICKINSCESTLKECVSDGCFGKANCKSCVEDYLPTCSRCVDDIYDESTQITLPDNRKTIICDINNSLHTAVCNFFCRSLLKPNYKCEIVSDIPVCNCFDTATSTTSTTTKIHATYPSNILKNPLKLNKI
jgi:hypothetical protein